MTAKKGFLGIMILIVGIMLAFALVGCDDGNDNGNKSPEQKTDVERWDSWVDASATVSVNLSVGNDGVCTIDVNGTAMPSYNRWSACADYQYTAQKDKTYTYKFEAWTDSGERDLEVLYYNGYYGPYEDPGRLSVPITINNTRSTYTITGDPVLGSRIVALQFLCADQLGTFYVKVISITAN
jgi:hypothetical protein